MELLYYREKANAAIQHSVLTRTEMFPGWGECRYLNASLKPKAPRKGTSKRNLLVVDAIGSSLARLYNVERNIVRHFDTNKETGSWDCLVMDYGRLSNAVLSCLEKHCEIERQHAAWGEFLGTITPTLVQHYAHILLMLDDVWVPDDYVVEHDLLQMDAHRIDVLSPAVVGAHHTSTRGNWRGARKCLYSCHISWPPDRPRLLEYFFTFFTADAWKCFYHSVLARNVGTKKTTNVANEDGCGYDICFPVLCPHLRFGLEKRSTVYHTEVFYRGQVRQANLVADTGYGAHMMPYKNDFVKKTGNKCEWHINDGNCTAVQTKEHLDMEMMGRFLSDFKVTCDSRGPGVSDRVT